MLRGYLTSQHYRLKTQRMEEKSTKTNGKQKKVAGVAILVSDKRTSNQKLKKKKDKGIA